MTAQIEKRLQMQRALHYTLSHVDNGSTPLSPEVAMLLDDMQHRGERQRYASQKFPLHGEVFIGFHSIIVYLSLAFLPVTSVLSFTLVVLAQQCCMDRHRGRCACCWDPATVRPCS